MEHSVKVKANDKAAMFDHLEVTKCVDYTCASTWWLPVLKSTFIDGRWQIGALKFAWKCMCEIVKKQWNHLDGGKTYHDTFLDKLLKKNNILLRMKQAV